METPQGPSRSDPRAACRLLCQVLRPSGRDIAGATGPLPQSDRDKSPPQGSAPPAHPDTMRSARPIAATVPASLAPPELALETEPGRVPRADSPEPQALRTHWPAEGSRKAIEINSALEISRLILLLRSASLP